MKRLVVFFFLASCGVDPVSEDGGGERIREVWSRGCGALSLE